jgi:hypothetical protein
VYFRQVGDRPVPAVIVPVEVYTLVYSTIHYLFSNLGRWSTADGIEHDAVAPAARAGGCRGGFMLDDHIRHAVRRGGKSLHSQLVLVRWEAKISKWWGRCGGGSNGLITYVSIGWSGRDHLPHAGTVRLSFPFLGQLQSPLDKFSHFLRYVQGKGRAPNSAALRAPFTPLSHAFDVIRGWDRIHLVWWGWEL